jgi:hypothetical protein
MVVVVDVVVFPLCPCALKGDTLTNEHERQQARVADHVAAAVIIKISDNNNIISEFQRTLYSIRINRVIKEVIIWLCVVINLLCVAGQFRKIGSWSLSRSGYRA